MRSFSSSNATLTAEYGIDIGRWAQYAPSSSFPFEAMWCIVPPTGRSARDEHPEQELAVVVSGSAVFTSDNRSIDAPAGTAVLLEPGERHVIHNHAETEPVRILSLYWLPGATDRPSVTAAESA